MKFRTLVYVFISLLPGLLFAAVPSGDGGLANQPAQAVQGPCSNLGCEADCARLSNYSSGGMLSRSCGNRCATTNFFESGTTPTSFMASCMKNGIKDLECAQSLAELVPTSPPGIEDVYFTYKSLFEDGPCADL